MDKKRILIYLDDPSGFTVGPALADFLKDVSLVDLQHAEMTSINLRENAFREWLEKLADELNDAMSNYGWEVRLIHLDTSDYLEFVEVEKVERPDLEGAEGVQ